MSRQNRFLVLAALLASVYSPPVLAEEPLTADSLIGAWRLVSVETVRPNGDTLTGWMGKQPSGLIVYLPSGLMSVQFMRDPRPSLKGPNFGAATPTEKVAAIDGYYAYFGSYEVDASARTVTHHVQASLRPDEVGLHYKRLVSLAGDRLTLSTPPFEVDGEKRFNRLVWTRAK